MKIQVLEKNNSTTYYEAQIPNRSEKIIFKFFTFREEPTLDDVYNIFTIACKNLTTRQESHVQQAFSMFELNKHSCKLELNNFQLYEYEKFHKKNENADVKLKSVCVEVMENGFMYYFESYDENSDLEKKSVFNYCEKKSQELVKELEELFGVEYNSTEYYISC